MLYINDIKINIIKYVFQYRGPKIQNQTYTYSKSCVNVIFSLFAFNGGGGGGGGENLDSLYFTAILHHFHIWLAMECQNVLLGLWLGQ